MPAEIIVKSINEKRAELKAFARDFFILFGEMKRSGGSTDPKSDNGEMFANLMLAYRHLEDSSMRMGKAIQAADGGESVYDKKTTVGAPDEPEVSESRKPYNDK